MEDVSSGIIIMRFSSFLTILHHTTNNNTSSSRSSFDHHLGPVFTFFETPKMAEETDNA
jgi:hypothetical protein